MKTYTTPELTSKGNVVHLTQGGIGGMSDSEGAQRLAAPGSVGFNL